MANVDSFQIVQEKTHLERLWGNARSNWEENARFYNQEENIWTGPRAQELARIRPSYRPGIWTSIPDHAVSYQVSDQPKIKRYPATGSKLSKERADRVENFLYIAFERWQQHSIDPPIRAGYRNMFIYGYMQLNGPRMRPIERVEPRQGRNESDEEYEYRLERYHNDIKSKLPFYIDVPPPTELLMNPRFKYPDHGIRVARMYGYQLEELSQTKASQGKGRVWSPSDPAERYKEVVVWEYFDFDRHILMLNGGDVVVDEPNLWGIIPFKHAFTGWGGRPVSEYNFDPKYLAKGLYDPCKDVLRLVAQHMTAKASNLADMAYARWRISPGTDTRGISRALSTFGAPVIAHEGEVGRIPTEELPSSLFRNTAELMQDLELATYAFTLMGLRQEGVSTATQQAILSNAAQRIFGAPTAQMEGLMSLAAGDILRLMNVWEDEYGYGELRLGGEVLRARDIEGDYNVNVQFELLDPMLHLNEMQHTMAEVHMGLNSWEGYQRVARREDISGLRKEIIEDAVYTVMMQAVGQEAANELYKGGMAEAVSAAADRLAGTPGMGGNGDLPQKRQFLNNYVPVPPGATPQPPIPDMVPR